MSMIYLFACPDPTYASLLAKKEAKKDFPVRNDTNFVVFNMAVSTPKELAYEAEYLPLGEERKCIIAENCAFLQKGAKIAKKNKLEGMDDLLQYCLHPAPYTDLYLIVYDDKLEEKSDLYLALKKNATIHIEKAPDEALLRQKLQVFLAKRGMSMDEDAQKELFLRVGDNYAIFGNELKKLSTYANGERITLDAVKSLVSRKIDDNVFALSDALLGERIEEAFRVYEDLKIAGVDEVSLLGLLSTSFRFLDEVSYLNDRGCSKREIAQALSANEYRVGKNLQILYRIHSDSLETILEELYLTASMILSGNATPEFAFTRFLANFSIKK